MSLLRRFFSNSFQKYRLEYQASLSNPSSFWLTQSKELKWFTPPSSELVLTKDEKNYDQWFKGGKLNASWLAYDLVNSVREEKFFGTDYQASIRPKQIALAHDSPNLGLKQTMTYEQLAQEVGRVAHILQHNFNVKKGDRVLIYMPMTIEAVVSMLACSRIGAIHSVVFGGFAAKEVAFRLKDLSPKLVISATGSIEIDRLIDYGTILEEAFKHPDYLNGDSSKAPLPVLFVDRPQLRRRFPGQLPVPSLWPKHYHNYMDLVTSSNSHAAVVETDATDILYVLYTSGTTGKPKGIVRDHGAMVGLKYSLDKIMNVKPGSVYFAASDIGWVVGHSYSVYGPLIQGCTSVIFEGKPVKCPNAGTFWRMIQEYNVSTLFSAPTAFRAIRKEDPDAKFVHQAGTNISCLKNVFVAGERLDPSTLEWLQGHLKCNIIDNWWQTESGWPMIALPVGITGNEKCLPVKQGSSSLPMPGYDIRVVDESGNELPANQSGSLIIKLPLPPSFMRTVWNDHARFVKGYLQSNPGYYLTGDGGYIDKDGYIYVMGRIDDVINVAGHRLSTGEMEELVSSNSEVAECCVVAIADSLRGDVPVAFIVLKDSSKVPEEKVKKDLVDLIRKDIGALACFKTVIVVKRLPKTRSGKILRKTIRQLSSEAYVSTPSTIDDPEILEEIRSLLQLNKVGPLYTLDKL